MKSFVSSHGYPILAINEAKTEEGESLLQCELARPWHTACLVCTGAKTLVLSVEHGLLVGWDAEVVPSLWGDDVVEVGVGIDDTRVGAPSPAQVDGAAASDDTVDEGVASVLGWRSALLR